jgi:predicted RNA binding protein YcfA (HicA-like mRNA interferase family)
VARLPSLSARKLVGILERKGFKFVRQKGSHASYRHPDGRTATVPMHRDVPKGTLRDIMKQADLSPDDLTK